MLFESDVVNALCAKLESLGYSIHQRLGTTQRGDDIVAAKKRGLTRMLYIEAKGETSSRRGSERYGKPFDSAQMRIHVAEAFYKAAEVLSKKPEEGEVRAGMALPDSAGHRVALGRIEKVVSELGIAVFWVRDDAHVQAVSIWDL